MNLVFGPLAQPDAIRMHLRMPLQVSRIPPVACLYDGNGKASLSGDDNSTLTPSAPRTPSRTDWDPRPPALEWAPARSTRRGSAG